MTDGQIVEALECCVKYENYMACRGCPFNESGICEEDGLALQKHSLDLIKRQQAKIKKLKSMDVQVEVSKRLEKEIRKEAIKDFAERLKTTKAMHYCKCGKTIDTTEMINNYIDTLVVEITGGD